MNKWVHFYSFQSAFSLEQTVGFKQAGQPTPSFGENALPTALNQPNPERFDDRHAFAAGFQRDRLHDFKHRIHVGAIHNVQIRAHVSRILADRMRIRCNHVSAATVIQIRQWNVPHE